MNSFRLMGILLLVAFTCPAAPPILSPSGPSAVSVSNEAINYTIRVEWKDAKKGSSSLQIITSAGSFQLDTISGAVKINDSDVPTTVKMNGTITELNAEHGRLQLFLGRTMPYVTSTFAGSGGGRSSSYSQLSVGLESTFIVTFGKPLVIQTDDNGTVAILVKRGEN